MLTSRFPLFLLFFALLGFTLGSCQKEESVAPASIAQQLTAGSWRLDQIKEAGQVTSSGAGIKDQYSLTFSADGTYLQKLVADNTMYHGTWMLMNNSTVLHLTDHKGSSAEYSSFSLTASEMRYSFTNKNNQLEEHIFSAQLGN